MIFEGGTKDLRGNWAVKDVNTTNFIRVRQNSTEQDIEEYNDVKGEAHHDSTFSKWCRLM